MLWHPLHRSQHAPRHRRDGTENDSYCKWCYDDGQFAYQSEDELIEKTAPFLMEATGMSQEEAVSFMGVLVPHLKHWQK